jgi:hypothetical protein
MGEATVRTRGLRIPWAAPLVLVAGRRVRRRPLGVSVSANVDWIGGRSRVLPGGLAAMIVAGPVLRWSAK